MKQVFKKFNKSKSLIASNNNNELFLPLTEPLKYDSREIFNGC